jgi:heat shock protein HslJ
MTTCRALLAIAAMAAIAGAAPQAEAASATPLRDLAGSEWGFAWSKTAFVQFGAGGKVSGFSGCNRFRGSYTFRDGALKIGPLMSTRMACPDMAAEARVMHTLQAAERAEATHLKLILNDASGQVLATLARRDFD